MFFFCVFFEISDLPKKRQNSVHDFQAHSAHVDEHSDDSTEHSDHTATEHAEPHAEHDEHSEHSTEHSEEHSTDWASVQATWLMVRLVSTMQLAGQRFLVPNLFEMLKIVWCFKLPRWRSPPEATQRQHLVHTDED